jgi:3-hydroxyacyl-[acyl-carrier-protein] dehydratase
MPGVLIIEALAQSGAVALLKMEKYKGKIAYFTGIDKAKFRQRVVPGDTLKLEVEIIKIKGPAGIGKALATVNGKTAAEAELRFFVG